MCISEPVIITLKCLNKCHVHNNWHHSLSLFERCYLAPFRFYAHEPMQLPKRVISLPLYVRGCCFYVGVCKKFFNARSVT